MKIKIDYWLSKDDAGKQISFIPGIDFFWSDDAYCLIITLFIIEIEFWFGENNV